MKCLPSFTWFLVFCCYFTCLRNRSAKYEKLGKYLSYCTGNRAITNPYRDNQPTLLQKDLTHLILQQKLEDICHGSP